MQHRILISAMELQNSFSVILLTLLILLYSTDTIRIQHLFYTNDAFDNNHQAGKNQINLAAY